MKMFQFGNVVVVEDDRVGVIVKSWENGTHDVYVRSYNAIKEFKVDEIQHYVYSKSIPEEELKFYE